MKIGDRVKGKWSDGYGLIVEITPSSLENPGELYGTLVLWDDGVLSRRPNVLLEVVYA
jgi:hypothetical protein